MAHSLEAIFEPRSVAIIGASWDPTKRGHQAIRALLEHGYRGGIHPVNPKGGELLGLPVSPSVAEIDGRPELALVCTPALTVPAVLEECAAKGIRGAVVLALGFGESGEEGTLLEARLREVARRTGVRVVGPNTSGILNLRLGLNLIGARGVRAGRLALLVQSGNVALGLLNESAARGGEGVSICVGVGNETDVGFHEYLSFLEADAGTAAILMYVEGFRDGRAFLEAAGRVVETKPVVLLKGGRSDVGRTAARSHTGAVTGEYRVLRSALRQAGVIEVRRTDELFAVGEALARQPAVPAGAGVVVLSDGGGHATLAADALDELGVPLAVLADTTRAALRTLLGPAASISNPIDVAGAGDRAPGIFAETLCVLHRDPAVGGVLVVGLFGGYALRFSAELAEEEARAARSMAEAVAEAGRPLVLHSLYARSGSDSLRALREAGIPIAESLEVAARCTAALWERGRDLIRPRVTPECRRPAAPACFVAARRERRTLLLEPEARDLVAAYGVPCAPAVFCGTAEETAAAVEEMGGPVALKLVSSAIAHKTEAGGVVLGVADARGAVEAFERIRASSTAFSRRRDRRAAFRGVLVSPMLPPPSAEILVGARRDPQLGLVLTVGAGGTAVELWQDVAVRVLPVGRDEVLEMLREIRAARLLDGWRGRAAASRDALADVALSLAACLLANPEVGELEANPVFAYADRAVAVDVRAFLAGGGSSITRDAS